MFVVSITCEASGTLEEAAPTYCRYDESIRDIYQNRHRLKTTTAQTQLHTLRNSHPENAARIHMENYLDCLKLFITQDEAQYQRSKSRKNERLDLINQLPSDDSDTEYLHAEINLQWAAVRFKFGEYFTAFTEVRKAYKSLEQAIERDPNHQPAHMRLAILETLIGTIPEPYQWGAKLIGLHGSISGGMNRLNSCIAIGKKTNAWYLPEAVASKIFLEQHVNNRPEEAIKGLEDPVFKPIKGPLYIFLAASIYRKTGKNNQAIQVLSQYLPNSSEFPIHFLHYMKGESLLRMLDKGAAAEFKNYLRLHTGQGYIKASYQKLAWHSLIHEGKEAYLGYIDQALNRGDSKQDEDKSALREAKRRHPPIKELLESRLLFDGGYYERSLQSLSRIDKYHLKDEEELEFLYRQGRSKEMLHKYEEAIAHYDLVIEKGISDPSYYACNAALLTGQIYENKGKYKKAIVYYNRCLGMKPEEYRSGIHQKAKAGILRINN